MTTLLRIAICAASLAPAAIFAQTGWHATASNFQQEGWMRFPGSGLTTVHPDTLVGQSGPVTGRPLSADEVRRTTQILADGTKIENSETDHFYRDGLGRMRTETATGAVIYDPIAGYTYDLTARNKTYTRSSISPNATVTIAAQAHQSSVSSYTGTPRSQHKSDRHGVEGVEEDYGPVTLNGIAVKGARVTVTIPAGTVGNDRELKSVNERWFSDDLKLLIKSSNTDPRFGTTTYELTNIVQLPPDPALFQVPPDYTLVTGH